MSNPTPPTPEQSTVPTDSPFAPPTTEPAFVAPNATHAPAPHADFQGEQPLSYPAPTGVPVPGASPQEFHPAPPAPQGFPPTPPAPQQFAQAPISYEALPSQEAQPLPSHLPGMPPAAPVLQVQQAQPFSAPTSAPLASMRRFAVPALICALVGLFIPAFGLLFAVAGLIVSMMGIRRATRAGIPRSYMSMILMARGLSIAALILQPLYIFGWAFTWVHYFFTIA